VRTALLAGKDTVRDIGHVACEGGQGLGWQQQPAALHLPQQAKSKMLTGWADFTLSVYK
jgi:hypothetical protein